MVSRFLFSIGIGCAFLCQCASAQPKAQIKKTATPPVIDGNANEAVWANANAYGSSDLFISERGATGEGVQFDPYQPSPDFSIEWRALWDNTNLYVMAKINDDEIINNLDQFGGPDTSIDAWQNDSVEFYIDAQDVNNTEYNPATLGSPTEPTFQFTSTAGWTPAIADDPNNPGSPRPNRDPSMLPNTSFTWGVNSYDSSQANSRYPQTRGNATSGPVTANPAGGFDWTFEASFPWEALEETPADILARNGIFGLGVAYNDDDDRAERDNQYMWATPMNDLWHVSASFPDVQLVDAPAPLQGDYSNNGTVDAADYVRWRDNPGAFGGDPAGYNTWRMNFGRTAGAASGLSGGAVASPEPATLAMFLLLTTPLALRRRRC